MQITGYIEELLYRYNCVVVPEFGAFLAQRKSAVLDKSANTFYPPTKVISFNEQLSANDGLLVSYMSQALHSSYEIELQNVLTNSKAWKKKLQNGERLQFANIGELWLNREGKIQFQPNPQINYLTASFGLASVISPLVTRELLKQEVVEIEERIPFMITPEERRRRNFRPFLKYAAILLLAFSAGLSGYRFYDNAQMSEKRLRQNAQQEVTRNIQEATFFNTQPLELPALPLNISLKDSKGQHHVIAGAFRIRANADKKVLQLQNRGYNAAYLGVNKYGLHQVTYDSFTDSEEALKFLKNIKQAVSEDAWLLSTH